MVADKVVRIGVTGHRTFGAVEDAAANVEAVLDRWAGAAVAVLEVRSSLAEGADRLVAERVLKRPGGRLIALLPLEPSEYVADFADPASRAAFHRLLDAAAAVEITELAASREAAYEAAGRAVVDASDVLIALWDGGASQGRGGTTEIVGYARATGVPVEVVSVRREDKP